MVLGITSLPHERVGAEALLGLTRGHWGIENGLHGVRDGTLREDASRIRKGAATQTMAVLRNIVVFLFHRLGHKSTRRRHDITYATPRSRSKSCQPQNENETALEADGVELLSEDETDKLKSFCVWSQTARQDRRSEAVVANIFLSYRREDSAGVAGRIYDRLRAHFGPDSVFIDVDAVPLGVDFQEHIESVLNHCGVLLAVIGPHWAGKATLVGVSTTRKTGFGLRLKRP